MSIAPCGAPASSMKNAVLIGLPKMLAMEAKLPVDASSGALALPRRTTRATASPKAEPSAMSGASGPSTAPHESVISAASMTPAISRGWVGTALKPFAGSCPPSPGSSRAKATRSPPTVGTSRIHHHGGAESPRWSGIVVQRKSVRCCSSQTKPIASRATGMPMSAAITRDWRYAFGSMACFGGAAVASVTAEG